MVVGGQALEEFHQKLLALLLADRGAVGHGRQFQKTNEIHAVEGKEIVAELRGVLVVLQGPHLDRVKQVKLGKLEMVF